MTLSDVYLEVAERALMAADAALAETVQEKAAFLGYHAFESTGGAFCAARGVQYPLNHASKLNVFKAAARAEKYARAVAELAIAAGWLETCCLPQVLGGGTVKRPRQVITEPQARRLLGRVRALTTRVKASL